MLQLAQIFLSSRLKLCYIQASVKMEHGWSQKHNLNLRKSMQDICMEQLDHLGTVLVHLGRAMKHFIHLRESSRILVVMNMPDR